MIKRPIDSDSDRQKLIGTEVETVKEEKVYRVDKQILLSQFPRQLHRDSFSVI